MRLLFIRFYLTHSLWRRSVYEQLASSILLLPFWGFRTSDLWSSPLILRGHHVNSLLRPRIIARIDCWSGGNILKVLITVIIKIKYVNFFGKSCTWGRKYWELLHWIFINLCGTQYRYSGADYVAKGRARGYTHSTDLVICTYTLFSCTNFIVEYKIGTFVPVLLNHPLILNQPLAGWFKIFHWKWYL